MAENKKLGLIAGNGSFPLLLLDAARAQGSQVVVAAIKEETSPLIENSGAAAVHWLSLGELGKLIDTFKREGVSTAIMAVIPGTWLSPTELKLSLPILTYYFLLWCTAATAAGLRVSQ